MPHKMKKPVPNAPPKGISRRVPRLVTSVPAVISAPGVYCLSSDLSLATATGVALRIEANDVVLDLNGFTLSGKAAGPASTVDAIQAGSRSGLIIRNGTITGFYRGVVIQGTSSHACLIERLLLYDLTYEGIRAEGWGHIIRGNRLLNITGNPDAAAGGNGGSAAIGVYGAANAVLDNDVADVYGVHGGEYVYFGTGINLNASTQSIVENNRLINRTFEMNSYGIFVGESPDVLVIGNRMISWDMGVSYVGASTGAYRDNLCQACQRPYSGGTDAGRNQ